MAISSYVQYFPSIQSIADTTISTSSAIVPYSNALLNNQANGLACIVCVSNCLSVHACVIHRSHACSVRVAGCWEYAQQTDEQHYIMSATHALSAVYMYITQH